VPTLNISLLLKLQSFKKPNELEVLIAFSVFIPAKAKLVLGI